METLSTRITPTAYQIVSFAWKLAQVSEGRRGERAVAAERRGAAREPGAARPIRRGGFLHAGERRAEEIAAAGRRSLIT